MQSILAKPATPRQEIRRKIRQLEEKAERELFELNLARKNFRAINREIAGLRVILRGLEAADLAGVCNCSTEDPGTVCPGCGGQRREF